MSEPLAIADLSETGVLWLINRVVFHPRGLALAFHTDDQGAVCGWSLKDGGGEVWTFPEDVDQEMFQRAEVTLRAARGEHT